MRERKRETETERERHTERDRKRETERDRKRQRETEKRRERERERVVWRLAGYRVQRVFLKVRSDLLTK